MRRILIPAVAALVLCLSVGLGAQQHFSIADVVAIKYPSAPQWSADGHNITFTWDVDGVHQLYTVDADHPGTPTLVSEHSATAAPARRGNWSPDGSLRLVQVGGRPEDHNRSFPEIGDKLIFRITGRQG